MIYLRIQLSKYLIRESWILAKTFLTYENLSKSDPTLHFQGPKDLFIIFITLKEISGEVFIYKNVKNSPCKRRKQYLMPVVLVALYDVEGKGSVVTDSNGDSEW